MLELFRLSNICPSITCAVKLRPAGPARPEQGVAISSTLPSGRRFGLILHFLILVKRSRSDEHGGLLRGSPLNEKVGS